ncbi:hypothetical protein HK096_004517, partial [Nowakowskiella sp. JEL0078]
MGEVSSLQVPLITTDKTNLDSFELFSPLDPLFETENMSVLSAGHSHVSISISTADSQAHPASVVSNSHNLDKRSAPNSIAADSLPKKAKQKHKPLYAFRKFLKSLFSKSSRPTDEISEMAARRMSAPPNLNQSMVDLLESTVVPKTPQPDEEKNPNANESVKIPEFSQSDNIQAAYSSLDSGSATLRTKSNTSSPSIEPHLADSLEIKDIPDLITYVDLSKLDTILKKEENSTSPEPPQLEPPKSQSTNAIKRPESPRITKSALAQANKLHLHQSASFSSLPRPSTPYLHVANANVSPRHSLSDLSVLSDSSRRPRSVNAILKQLKEMESQGVRPLSYSDPTSLSSLDRYPLPRSLVTFIRQGSSDDENETIVDSSDDDLQPPTDVVQVSSERRLRVRFAEVAQTFTWIVPSDEESDDDENDELDTDERDTDDYSSDDHDDEYRSRQMGRGRPVLKEAYRRRRDYSPAPGMWVKKDVGGKRELVWVRRDLSPGPRRRDTISKRDSLSRRDESSWKRRIEFEGRVKILDQGPRWK